MAFERGFVGAVVRHRFVRTDERGFVAGAAGGSLWPQTDSAVFGRFFRASQLAFRIFDRFEHVAGTAFFNWTRSRWRHAQRDYTHFRILSDAASLGPGHADVLRFHDRFCPGGSDRSASAGVGRLARRASSGRLVSLAVGTVLVSDVA